MSPTWCLCPEPAESSETSATHQLWQNPGAESRLHTPYPPCTPKLNVRPHPPPPNRGFKWQRPALHWASLDGSPLCLASTLFSGPLDSTGGGGHVVTGHHKAVPLDDCSTACTTPVADLKHRCYFCKVPTAEAVLLLCVCSLHRHALGCSAP